MQFNILQTSMSGLASSVYKIAVKLSGQFSATCNPNEINIITIDIAGYPANQQTITLKAPVAGGAGNFITSSQYFAANSAGSLTLTLTYA
jgi:hypothetical protein